MVNHFRFQASPEAFHRRIIEAIAFTRHRNPKPKLPQLPPSSELVADRYGARWALAMGAFIVLLLAMIVFTGVHFASMPLARRDNRCHDA